MVVFFAFFFSRANTNTLSRSRVFLTCNFKLCMSTNRICLLCCFWKLDAHQPVKPPFSTAFNKTIRFIWNGNKVMRCAKPCYFMLDVLLHSSRLRLRHFSICYSRFLLLNESISICCRLVEFKHCHHIVLVCSHNLCNEYTMHLCLLISTFCSKQNKTRKKEVQTDSIQTMFVSVVVRVCVSKQKILRK